MLRRNLGGEHYTSIEGWDAVCGVFDCLTERDAIACQLHCDADGTLIRALVQEVPLSDDPDQERFWPELFRFFLRYPVGPDVILDWAAKQSLQIAESARVQR